MKYRKYSSGFLRPILIGILLSIFVISCETTDNETERLSGFWSVKQTGGSLDGITYDVSIDINPEDSTEIFIWNFMNLGGDAFTDNTKYRIKAKVNNYQITFPSQSIDDYTIYTGSGTISTTFKTFTVFFDYSDPGEEGVIKQEDVKVTFTKVE